MVETMNVEFVAIAVGLAGGFASGAAFFGGLYATTSRIARARRPGLLVTASFVVRTVVVLAAAWLVGTSFGPWSLLAYLVGITAARIVLVALARRRALASVSSPTPDSRKEDA
ncbi:MAG: ATP synthase subunit I [Spirochaetota bacterium]